MDCERGPPMNKFTFSSKMQTPAKLWISNKVWNIQETAAKCILLMRLSAPSTTAVVEQTNKQTSTRLLMKSADNCKYLSQKRSNSVEKCKNDKSWSLKSWFSKKWMYNSETRSN